jgi:Cd2+/Zn2+-exporting ATPase
MKKLGISFIPCHSTGTIVHVAIDGEYSGHILITDILRPTAKRAIRDLKLTGVEKTVMLTGDSEGVAKNVAKELFIDETHAGLLPADKVSKIEEILDKKQDPRDTIVFVGDGINDAPVLSRADVGIAMGGLGSDAAIEAADIVLMDDDPSKIALAVKIARKAMRIVYENIFGAIGIKVLCLLISATGLLGTYAMWLAIFADTGVLVLAVLNSMRALTYHDRSSVEEN